MGAPRSVAYGLAGKSELIRRLKNGKFHVDHTGYFRTRECRYVSIIFLAIFSGDIPWNLGLKFIGLIYGRYLQFRFLKWPLSRWSNATMHLSYLLLDASKKGNRFWSNILTKPWIPISFKCMIVFATLPHFIMIYIYIYHILMITHTYIYNIFFFHLQHEKWLSNPWKPLAFINVTRTASRGFGCRTHLLGGAKYCDVFTATDPVEQCNI